MRGLVLLLTLLLAACMSPAREVSPSRFVEIERIVVPGLPDQRVSIWLPPGYDSGKQRYGVLYMHDGQNLFDPARAHYGKVWHADEVVTALAEAGVIEPVIIVGIWSPIEDRYRQYLPQFAYANASLAMREAMDQHAGGKPVISARYLEWLADDLKPRIDAQYRTRTDPAHTVIAGASMGGIMSCYAAIERPDIFGRAGCVSSHWPLADPDKLEIAREADVIWRDYILEKVGSPERRRIWMDHGTATLDAHYPARQAHVSWTLRAAGWEEGQHFTAREYPGAEHDEIAWNARLPEMLTWLLTER